MTEDLSKPRINSIGTSNKKITDIMESLNVSTVNNDVPDNWRIVTLEEDIDVTEYSLNYYHTYFTDDKELHDIVNFKNNTTGKISVMGNILNVTIYKHMDKEENDAALLYSGRLLKEFFVYMDNGDIEEIQ